MGICVVGGFLSLCGAAAGDTGSISLRLDPASALAAHTGSEGKNQPSTPPSSTGSTEPGSPSAPESAGNSNDGQESRLNRPDVASRRFGAAGTHWLTFGTGYANDFASNHDVNLHAAWSTFIVDYFEFSVEGAAWYFAQEGDDTAGLNPSMIFHWHFWHSPDNAWTTYADAGIGLLFAFDTVPDGGTGFNFTPRAGVGFTREISDDGTRFQMGLRWHHISNGRIDGDERNPSRDALMVYAGIIIPF